MVVFKITSGHTDHDTNNLMVKLCYNHTHMRMQGLLSYALQNNLINYILYLALNMHRCSA
jgi:hypothetical protein